MKKIVAVLLFLMFLTGCTVTDTSETSQSTMSALQSSSPSASGVIFSGESAVSNGEAATVTADGVLFSEDMTILLEFPKERTGTYTVPESVREIGGSAFYESALTGITLPAGLERIGDMAFSFSSLVQVQIPQTVEYIGRDAFNNCYDLTDIYVPNGDAEMPGGFPVLYNTMIHTTAGSALHRYAFDNYILVETENNLFFSDPYVYPEKTVDSGLLPNIAANPCTAEAALWLCRNTVGEYREEDLFSDVQSTVDCYKGLESGEYDLILVPKIDGLLQDPDKYEFVKFAEDALVVCTKNQSERTDISSQKLIDLYLNGDNVYWDEENTQRIIPYMTSAMRNLFPLLKYDALDFTENVVRSKVVYEFDGICLYHHGGIHAMFNSQTLTVDGKTYTDSDYPFQVEYYAVFLKSQPENGQVRKAVEYLTSEEGQLDCVWETLIGIKGDPGWI